MYQRSGRGESAPLLLDSVRTEVGHRPCSVSTRTTAPCSATPICSGPRPTLRSGSVAAPTLDPTAWQGAQGVRRNPKFPKNIDKS
jgi:hypothetical protein